MWKFFKNQKYLTVEEAIKIIVSQMTESQLKKLELIGSSGRVVTFESQLFLINRQKYCKYQITKELKDEFVVIEKKKKSKFSVNSFRDVFQEENPKQNEFIKEKHWKEQRLHSWINSCGILVSVIVPIILKFV